MADTSEGELDVETLDLGSGEDPNSDLESLQPDARRHVYEHLPASDYRTLSLVSRQDAGMSDFLYYTRLCTSGLREKEVEKYLESENYPKFGLFMVERWKVATKKTTTTIKTFLYMPRFDERGYIRVDNEVSIKSVLDNDTGSPKRFNDWKRFYEEEESPRLVYRLLLPDIRTLYNILGRRGGCVRRGKERRARGEVGKSYALTETINKSEVVRKVSNKEDSVKKTSSPSIIFYYYILLSSFVDLPESNKLILRNHTDEEDDLASVSEKLYRQILKAIEAEEGA